MRWVNTKGPDGELQEALMLEMSDDAMFERAGMKASPVADQSHLVVDCKLFRGSDDRPRGFWGFVRLMFYAVCVYIVLRKPAQS